MSSYLRSCFISDIKGVVKRIARVMDVLVRIQDRQCTCSVCGEIVKVDHKAGNKIWLDVLI